MSGEEKAAQIGSAVLEHQTARTELAHVDKRVKEVFSTYLELGATMDKSRGSIDIPKISNGKLDVGYRGSRINFSNLLNCAELTKLVEERDAATARLQKAEEELRNLGITSFERYSPY